MKARVHEQRQGAIPGHTEQEEQMALDNHMI